MARRRTTLVTKKHNNAWSSAISSTFIAIPANSKVLLTTFTLSNPNIDETVLRVIGNVGLASDQTAAIEENIGSVGMIVVSTVAIAAGIASIPGSSTDSNDDGWFCHQFLSNISQQVNTNPSVMMFPFASKGRRVVSNGEAIAVVAENIHSSSGLSVCLQFRLLSRVTGT